MEIGDVWVTTEDGKNITRINQKLMPLRFPHPQSNIEKKIKLSQKIVYHCLNTQPDFNIASCSVKALF